MEAQRARRLRALVDSGRFNALVTLIIALNALVIGAGTYTRDPSTARLLTGVEAACVLVFVVELVLRFLARRSTTEFVSDPWNVFDTIIILSALLPASNGLGPILRILRVLRVPRLVKVMPELRMIVEVLLRSVGSMKYVALLATILFYVYAVIGVKLFGLEGHPLRGDFSSIHEACFTLFRVLTGDDWTQLRYELAAAGHAVWTFSAYQVSWIVVATFLLVNLIVGAVINNYQRVQDIEEHRQLAPDTSEERVLALVRELDAILQSRVRRGGAVSEAGERRAPP